MVAVAIDVLRPQTPFVSVGAMGRIGLQGDQEGVASSVKEWCLTPIFDRH
jgi:hypothetical protein